MSEVKLSQLIGNVLDHWEQLTNDIRSDPGFTALDKCLGKLYRAQMNSSPYEGSITEDYYTTPKNHLTKDCGEDKFALAVRVLARLREVGLIQINGKTDEEWRNNLHKAQILTMQVINANE